MTFKEILDGRRLDESQIRGLMELLDVHASDMEDIKCKFAYLINNGHHSEYTSKKKISKMVPVVYIDREGNIMEANGMLDYLSRIGITPEIAYQMVSESYSRARIRASELGMSAPNLDCNIWDAYTSIAYVFSDYWVTINGKPEVASMLAYEYLSDPDKPKMPKIE